MDPLLHMFRFVLEIIKLVIKEVVYITRKNRHKKRNFPLQKRISVKCPPCKSSEKGDRSRGQGLFLEAMLIRSLLVKMGE